MAFSLFDDKGCKLAAQRFTWRDMVQAPISKLDDDAFTRVRIILMNGIELESLRFQHACARMNADLQRDLALVRRVEQHQATTVNWLLGADHSPLETTIGYEQVAIEVTAAVAQREPDPYLAQVYRFGLLEDFDHMYRYAALLDRLEGKDANNILQCYTDVLPGRPTFDEHRHPLDDLRMPYDRRTADPLSKLHALTIMAGEQQTHDYYMNIGPLFADPLARQLYAEIASRRCGSASWTTSSVISITRSICSSATSSVMRPRYSPRRCPSRFPSRASAISCVTPSHWKSTCGPTARVSSVSKTNRTRRSSIARSSMPRVRRARPSRRAIVMRPGPNSVRWPSPPVNSLDTQENRE